MWTSETCALFIRGVKITSHTKQHLTQHLLDGDIQEYLMTKDNWTRQAFDSKNWSSSGTAFKRIPRSRKTALTKACHNMWHTGEKHTQYYGGPKPCCMCGETHEGWRHMITCKSLDMSLYRTEPWTKVQKVIIAWKIPADFRPAIEKGINHYVAHPFKRDKENMPPEPVVPFGPTLHTPRNLLQVAFWKQSHVGSEKILKGWICK
jgi:hypothetical protein